MQRLFELYLDFLSDIAVFEPFLYALASMAVCAMVGLVIYLLRGDKP